MLTADYNTPSLWKCQEKFWKLLCIYGKCKFRFIGEVRITHQPKAPLCKGGWHIADFRQYDWGIVLVLQCFLQSLRQKSKIFATSLYTREAFVCASTNRPINWNLEFTLYLTDAAEQVIFRNTGFFQPVDFCFTAVLHGPGAGIGTRGNQTAHLAEFVFLMQLCTMPQMEVKRLCYFTLAFLLHLW